ncbi:MAG: diacylglycerol kinase, partial [Oscillospiraceae bacterium]
MRVHFCAAFYVVIFMQFYDLSAAEKAVVFLTLALVIAMEFLNTAVESAVDLSSDKITSLGKLAKDAASSAVLVSAIASVAVAFCVFWDIPTFKNIYSFFAGHVLWLVLLVISALVWFLFIFAVKKT